MKTISVIGSTGVIGKTALNVIKKLDYNVSALTAYSNLQLLKRQADEFKPEYVGVIDEDKYQEAKALFGKKLLIGKEALTIPSQLKDTDIVLVSVVGLNGLYSVIEAIKYNKIIALANKESLVAAGELVNNQLGKSKSMILPVDSEHSAVFQCLKSGKIEEVNRIILTASGGAFYDYDSERLDKITPKHIYHPNWTMGRKITLDSCTMMNKALEIIEAYHLFKTDRIEYVVHPESIIHSLVEFIDGSTIAQLGITDMSLPISYALSYPERKPCINYFDFSKPLTFKQKNPLFFGPELAKEVIQIGKSAGTIFNAANEAAVRLFEEEKIKFTDITRIVKNCLYDENIQPISSVEEVFDIHNQTIQKVIKEYKLLI